MRSNKGHYKKWKSTMTLKERLAFYKDMIETHKNILQEHTIHKGNEDYFSVDEVSNKNCIKQHKNDIKFFKTLLTKEGK